MFRKVPKDKTVPLKSQLYAYGPIGAFPPAATGSDSKIGRQEPALPGD